MQILGEVPEGSSADNQVRIPSAEVRSGSGRLRCRYRGQDPEGSSTEVRWDSGADTWVLSLRFRKVPVQMLR